MQNYNTNNDGGNNNDINDSPVCVESIFARYYPLLSAIHLLCTVIFCFYSLFLEQKIWHWSSQGTPTMRQPRTKNVQELLEKKIGICTVLLALIVGCIYFVAALFFARPYHQCFHSLLQSNANVYDEESVGGDFVDKWVGSRAWYALGALLAASQTAEVIFASLFYQRLKASADITNETNNSDSIALIHGIHHELTEELWADRCESLFRCLSISTCFLFGGKDLLDNAQRNNSYRHVAQALADYLETKGTLDVVPTDLFTGLFILQRIQRQRILQTRMNVFEESSALLSSAIGLESDRTNTGSSLPSTRSDADLPKPIDNHYHQLSSPSKTGLRSRVTSSNDLPAQAQPLSSSLIQSPAPPSRHLQQKNELRNQSSFRQRGKRNIYRRNDANQNAHVDLLEVPSNDSESSAFYHTTSRQVLDPSDPMDAATLEEGARLCKYALSIYTWMLYVFVHPITGLPRLVCQCGTSSGSCCKMCGILKRTERNGNATNSPQGSSMPLRRHEQTLDPISGRYDTTQQRQENMGASGHSSAGSEDFEQMETGTQDETFHQERFHGDCETSGDTFCEWHKRALLLVAGIPEADLVYAEFNNKLSSVPYCILLDHERSFVVLSVRGSLSLEDIVTDTLVLPESLEEVGNKYGFDGSGQYCHAGVLACFENVMRDLERHGWLERLLEDQYPNYSLRIVGHSLGAGVSTLLGYVFRSKYPSLKVFGYSPPGCTMTWEMAAGSQTFATTFILDSDIVPRLSVKALENLRDEVLELIGRIKVPKHEVYQNFWKGKKNDGTRSCLFGRGGVEANDYNYEDDLDELTHTIDETLDEVPSETIYQRQLSDFLRVQDERKQARGDTNSKNLRLYPPGKMIHLVRTGEESGLSHCLNQCLSCYTSNSGFVYTPMYISNDDLDEIVVTSTMGTDHFIDRMCDELHTISDKYASQAPGNGREAAAYPCGIGSGV